MMMMMKKMVWKLLLVVILCCYFFPSSEAVTCYICDSRTSPECDDPMQCKCNTGICFGDLCNKTVYGYDGRFMVYFCARQHAISAYMYMPVTMRRI